MKFFRRFFSAWMARLKNGEFRAQLLTFLVVVPTALFSAPITKPYTFTTGNVAKASEVNADFDALYTQVNANDARLTTLEGTIIGYASAAAVSGVPRLSTTSLSQTNTPGGHVGVYAVAGGSDYVLCPIQLPQGAVVTQIQYLYYDNDATYNTTAYLYRSDALSIASIGSSGQNASAVWVYSGTLSHTVDNTKGGYYVYMGVDSTAGTNIAPIAFVVKYTK